MVITVFSNVGVVEMIIALGSMGVERQLNGNGDRMSTKTLTALYFDEYKESTERRNQVYLCKLTLI